MKTTMTTTMTRRRRRAKREKDERETSRNPESSKSASNNKLIYTPNQATDQLFTSYYMKSLIFDGGDINSLSLFIVVFVRA